MANDAVMLTHMANDAVRLTRMANDAVQLTRMMQFCPQNSSFVLAPRRLLCLMPSGVDAFSELREFTH